MTLCLRGAWTSEMVIAECQCLGHAGFTATISSQQYDIQTVFYEWEPSLFEVVIPLHVNQNITLEKPLSTKNGQRLGLIGLAAFWGITFQKRGVTFFRDHRIYGQQGTALNLCICLCRQIKAQHPTIRYCIGLCFGTRRARRTSRTALFVCRGIEECSTLLSDAESFF